MLGFLLWAILQGPVIDDEARAMREGGGECSPVTVYQPYFKGIDDEAQATAPVAPVEIH